MTEKDPTAPVPNEAPNPPPAAGAPAELPEAPADRRFPRQTKVLIAAVAAVLILGLALVLVTTLGSQRRPRIHPKPKPTIYTVLHNRQFGEADAKVNVLVVLPLKQDCHARTIEYMKRVAENCPQQVRVRFVDLRTGDGAKCLKAAGLDVCASVVINGKNTVLGAKGATVALHGPLDENYTADDVCSAMKNALAAAYGAQAAALPPFPSADFQPPPLPAAK